MISNISTDSIQCPSCWESFEIVVPPISECPCEFDYDCEVCCRPFRVICDSSGQATAQSLGE
ncbi:CPXCG motif-containing cysteine-rich protein [Roseibacillus persicicus]|uniref:CPXCG motif-containing cysteine-rich protein n=1 Tax=Roseibacillus persicicus TaxID=454148 RepID=UPI00398AA771